MTSPLPQSVLLLFLLLPFWLFSQEPIRYDSIYQPVSGVTGNAKFSYLKKGDENIKTGEFLFTREDKDSLMETSAVYDSWKGEYKNNKKIGQWNYETKTHKVKINKISGVDLDYEIVTTDEVLSINYSDGLPEGEVTLETVLYVDNQRVKTLEKLKTRIADNLIAGDFEYSLSDEDEKIIEINGKATEGLMEGKWVFTYFSKGKKEVRDYTQGILTSISIYTDDRLTETLAFPLSEKLQEFVKNNTNSTELANRPLSLNFSDGYPRNSVYMTAQEQGNKELNTILNKIYQYSEDTKVNESFLALGANRALYPLSDNEEDLVEEWSTIEADYRKKIQNIKDLEIDNLTVVKDSTLQVVVGWANRQQEIQEYIQPWSNIFSKEQASYYNRDGLLIDYAKSFLAKDTIETKQKEAFFEYQPKDAEDTGFMEYIITNLKDRTATADSLTKEFTKQLEKIRLDQEIVGLNEEISAKKQQVDSIYTIYPKHEALKRILRNVKINYLNTTYERDLENFLSPDASREKRIQTGNEIIADLQLTKETYETVFEIFENIEKIDELYTIYTFDPFTYSDGIPSRAKKRLYSIVVEEMINKKINENISPQVFTMPAEILKKLRQISRIQERLVFLRDKDTGRLERKLRRSDSFEERIELLNNF